MSIKQKKICIYVWNVREIFQYNIALELKAERKERYDLIRFYIYNDHQLVIYLIDFDLFIPWICP